MNRLRSVNFDLLKSKVVLITTASVLILLLVWYFAWMSPEGTKLSTVQQQVTADGATVQSLNAELNALVAESKLVKKELPYLKQVTKAIPPNAEQPEIVNQLNALANDTGCKLGSVNPADTVAPSGTTGLSTISVDFGLSGSHKNVFRFLNDFYKLQRLMTINTVSLAPAGTSPNILAIGDGMQYSLTVTATAYTTYVTPVASTG